MKQPMRAVRHIAACALAVSLAGFAQADVIGGSDPWVTRAGHSHTTIVAPADIAGFDAHEHATVEVQAGEVSRLNMHDQSRANVLGGDVAWLRLHDDSHADVSAGDFSWIWLRDRSTVRITGADDLSWLVLDGASTRAEIVADHVTYSGGHLSGVWGDGRAFTFWAVEGSFMPSQFTPSQITITAVPEPASLACLGMGWLTLVWGARRRGSHAPAR